MKIKKLLVGLLAGVSLMTYATACNDDPIEETMQYDVSFDSTGGTAIEKITVDANGKITAPKEPEKVGYLFKGWFTDEACTEEFNFDTEITESITLYAKWVEGSKYSINFTDYCDGLALEENYTIKNVTLTSGCSLAGKDSTTIDGVEYKAMSTMAESVVLAAKPQKYGLSVRIGAAGKAKVWASCPEIEGEQTITIRNSNKKVVDTITVTNSDLFEIELETTEATTLYFIGSTAFNYYRIDSQWEIKNRGNLTGLEVTNVGSNRFIEGQEFSTNGLEVVAKYDSGYEEILMYGDSDKEYKVDISQFKKDTPGYYPITVEFGGLTTEYTAYVYDIQSFNADLYYMAKDTENIWGNGAIRNVHTRQLNFGNNDSYDTSALTISITGTVVNEKNKTLTKVFKLNNKQYNIVCDNYNKSTEGTYNVKIETPYGDANFLTYVVHTKPVITDNTVTVRVNANYSGVVGKTNEANEHMFTTLNTAIEYLTYSSEITDSMKKVIYVDAGTYNEKVDIDLPNVTLIGAGKDTTTITFDAANGKLDPRGTSFGTDGSCTFGVRSTATNFTAMNITFDSYYNNLERYNALKAETSGTQALAIMIQAEKSAFYNCGFTGFQDTIEMQGAGRQYFYKCFVSGATDYIFGTNSSALFEECEILTITNGQTANGGYITAPKGLNKGGDYTAFGYIFNKCNFTNDGLTTTNTTSLGRAWDNGASITIMNSELASHIATAAFDGADKARRLAAGLNGNWAATTTSCKEFNNTGAGAITESQSYKGVTTVEIITEAEANKMLTDFWGVYTVDCSDDRYDFTSTEWTKPIFE